MNGNPAVIAALNVVYQNLRATEEQSHLQEHCYETQGWASSKYWDKVEDEIHEVCVHYVLNRINDLGGRVTPGYAFDVLYWPDDFGAAINETISSLYKCRTAYGAACDAAEDDDDYVTEKMIWKHLKWIEARIVKFEGLALRFGKLGTVVMTGAM